MKPYGNITEQSEVWTGSNRFDDSGCVCVQLYTELMQDRDFGSKITQFIKTATGLRTIGGTSQTSAEGTTHSVRDEEQVAFSNWINK